MSTVAVGTGLPSGWQAGDNAGVDLDDIGLKDLDRCAAGFSHEIFRELSRRAPSSGTARRRTRGGGEGSWVVGLHADVLGVFQDTLRFTWVGGGSRRTGGTMIADPPRAGAMLNMMDDPRHERIRQLMNKGFTPRTIGSPEGKLHRWARSSSWGEPVRTRDHRLFGLTHLPLCLSPLSSRVRAV